MKGLTMRVRWGLALLCLCFALQTHAQALPTAVCPINGVARRTPDFAQGGIILTTFDRDAIWVYNIEQDTRYPLPETVPCTRNCRLSPDATWISRMDTVEFVYQKMRLDGTQRTTLAPFAADVEWWTPDTLLVWTLDHRAYLVPEANASDPATPRQPIDTHGVIDLQPGGDYALTVALAANGLFERQLENLELRGLNGIAGAAPIMLGRDAPYYNGAAWSPNGAWLAIVTQTALDPATNALSSELFGIRAGDAAPTQWTNLFGAYGATRINGHTIGDISWSPDSTKVAFWVIELLGADPLTQGGNAVIHLYDLNTGELRAYCGYSTIEHTPNPPRLIWSPNSTHIAFGGNVQNDDKGYLLLALNVQSGQFTELSDGIYPALGAPDVIAWGRLP